MKGFMKKPIHYFLVFVAAMLLVQAPVVYAASLSDLKSQKSEVDSKKDQLNEEIDNKSDAIKEVESKQDELLDQITVLGEKITETNQEVEQVKEEIEQNNKKITDLQQKIAELQEKIEQRDELLKDRIRSIQENGNVSYLDVLLGAESFVDFIDRFSAVNTLMEADRQIIQDQKNDKQTLEEEKVALENTKRDLENQQNKLETLIASLNSQKEEKNSLVDELEKEQEKLASEKQLLEKQYSEYLDLSKELQQKIIEEQNKYVDTAKSNNQTLPVSNSGFIKPATGVLTSPYGWRYFGGGAEFHYGLDIANSSGTPIHASADGVVSYSGPLGSYGNVVIITHSINGQVITTLYAHLSSYSVSAGTVVKQGQQIAKMGSTGNSTGPHVHFEVHIGTWQGQKVGVQNPLKYISL